MGTKIDLCVHMTIAAITERHTDKDLATLFPGTDIRRMKSVPAHHEPGIGAYVDLDFTPGVSRVGVDASQVEPDASRVERLRALLPALVLVNAVTPTLHEIGEPFVRINAWPGFGRLKVHELVTPDEATKQRIVTFYSQLDCECRFAPDLPGMISARIVAGIINEAWYTWEEKVSSKEEIDTAMRLGTNYPMGPFEWGERIGLGHVADLLWSLSKTDSRYMPAKALQSYLIGMRSEEK
jgi:3-hydroxybutyryl-CoA dehydrogenase